MVTKIQLGTGINTPCLPQEPITGKQPSKKLDTGKAPAVRGLFSYFPNALLAVANVSAYGAKKYNLDYSDKNWARVEGGLGRYSDALARHTIKHAASESHDPESHLLHVAHAAWNALAILELVLQTEPLEDKSTFEEIVEALQYVTERRLIKDRRVSEFTTFCEVHHYGYRRIADRRKG